MALGDLINVVAPDGTAGTIPRDKLQGALDAGYKLEGQAASTERAVQTQYGDSPIAAGLEGAARGASFGLSDLVLPELGVSSEGLRERRDRNAGAAAVGEVAGMVAPALLTGGGSAAGEVAAGAGRIAERGVASLASGGLLARAASRAIPAAVQTGTEGALYGLGQGISDVALSQDPMTAEAIAGDLGNHILVGGGLGVAAGAGTSLAATALGAAASKASKVVGKSLTKLQGELEAHTSGMLSTADPALRDEVLSMSRPALDAARKAETETLDATRLQQGQALAKDIEAFHYDNRNLLFKLRQQLPDKQLVRDGITATKSLQGVIGDLKSLAEDPATALKPLRRMQQQVGKMQDLLPSATLQPTLDSLNDLESRASALVGKPTSDRLQALDERITALDKGPPKTPILDAVTKAAGGGLGGALGHATGIPYAGMAGAWLGKEASSVLQPLVKRVLGAFASNASGLQGGVEAALGKLGAPGPAMDAVGRLATAAGVEGESTYDRATKAVTAAAANLDQTAGHLDQQLAGLQQVAPQTAQQVKQGLLAKIQFLASKVPPVPADMFTTRAASDPDQQRFARYAAAADNPMRLMQEFASGRVMPETVETAAALYPQHLARLQQAITMQLADPAVRARISYPMRLQLAAIMGRDVEPTLAPAFVAAIQAPPINMRPLGAQKQDATSAQRLTTH